LPNPVKFGAVSAGLGAIAISVLLIAAIEIGLTDLDTPARRALMIFAVAIVGWTLTPLDDTFVALAAAVAMALFVVGSPDDLFRALGDNLIWLLVTAFIFAAAYRASGLAQAQGGPSGAIGARNVPRPDRGNSRRCRSPWLGQSKCSQGA